MPIHFLSMSGLDLDGLADAIVRTVDPNAGDKTDAEAAPSSPPPRPRLEDVAGKGAVRIKRLGGLVPPPGDPIPPMALPSESFKRTALREESP